MRVKTFTLTVKFWDNSEKVFHGLSRVAVQRYAQYYDEKFTAYVYAIEEDLR